MRKKIIWIVVSGLMALSLVVAGCSTATTSTTTTSAATTSTTTTSATTTSAAYDINHIDTAKRREAAIRRHALSLPGC